MKKAHGIAAYPKGFRGCVVSEKKICLQFEAPAAKVRVQDRQRDELIKLPDGRRALPITEQECEIGFIAIGCNFEVLDAMLEQLTKALEEHRERFGERKRGNKTN